MAQSTAVRPQLAAPRRSEPPTLEAVRVMTGGQFDPDAWHVMDQRDNAMIEQEILHGAGSSKFVYSFNIAGQSDPVTGISVIGARHLAAHYGGIKHRIIASVRKRGALFTFQTYPQEGVPMQVSTTMLYDLEDEDDFYGVVVEVSDIKTGNTIQIEKHENKMGRARNGTLYERPHYDVIAQSKAYRNGVLSLISQDVQLAWKGKMLELGKDVIITASVLDEKRGQVLRFAAAQGLLVDRRAVEDLTMEQISGLGDAARESGKAAFVQAARGLGLEIGIGQDGEDGAQQQPPTAQQEQQPAQQPAKGTGKRAAARQDGPPPSEPAKEQTPAQTTGGAQQQAGSAPTQESPAGPDKQSPAGTATADAPKTSPARGGTLFE